MDFKVELNRVLGLCYATEEDNFPTVLERIDKFLDSEAPRDLKVKAVFAVFQSSVKNNIIKHTAVDWFRRLLKSENKDIFIEMLNQKSFIDFLAQDTPYPEKYAEIFVPATEQLFSDDTALYALSQKDARPGFVAIFSCHPAVLKDAELQKNAFRIFTDMTNIFCYSQAVYITDEIIDGFDPEEQFFLFKCMALHERVKKIAFSPEKIKNIAYLYLISGENVEKWNAEDILEFLQKIKIEYVSNVKPIKFNIDPDKHQTVFIDELLNADSVLAAIELLHPYNIKRMLILLSIFLNRHLNKRERKKVYITFRNKLISIMKQKPGRVTSALYFSKELDAVFKLFHDSGFQKAITRLKNRKNIHSDFEYYINEIEHYFKQKMNYSQSVSE